MKITENLSRDADSILSIELFDDERVGDDSNNFYKKANVVFKENASIHIFYDTDEDCGYGFCENLKTRIDAYFEAKENAVLHQDELIELEERTRYNEEPSGKYYKCIYNEKSGFGKNE